MFTSSCQQSKKLFKINERGSKIARNSVFDCLCRQLGDKWQSKTRFLTIFDQRSSIVLMFSIAAFPDVMLSIIESNSSLSYSVMATKRRAIRCRRWVLNGICARKVRIELLHPRIQRGDRGSTGPGPTHPLENYKELGFLSNSGLIPWKITELHRGTGRVKL